MRLFASGVTQINGTATKVGREEGARERPQKYSEAKNRLSLICSTHPRSHAMNKMQDKGEARVRNCHYRFDATGKSDKAGKSKRDMKREDGK